MENQITYKGISQVFAIDSGELRECELCTYYTDALEDAVNHYISAHGCILLHMGQETRFRGDNGEDYEVSVAYVGVRRKADLKLIENM